MPFSARIGINPISWTNDDLPSLGGETPLETALAEGKAIGYEGFELGNKFPREPEALRAVLARHGLACVSGWYSGRLARGTVRDEIASVEPHLALLAANGAQVMVYGEVADSIQGRPRGAVAAAAVSARCRVVGLRRTRDGVRAAHGSRGVRLAYHHHMGAYVESAEDVDRLMAVTGPEVGLLHRHRSRHVRRRRRADRAREARRARRSRPLQGRAAGRRADGAQPRLELPRRGDQRRVHARPAKAASISRASSRSCATHGYRGWLVVEGEQDPVVAPAYRYADMAYRLLARAASTGRATPSRARRRRPDAKECGQ